MCWFLEKRPLQIWLSDWWQLQRIPGGHGFISGWIAFVSFCARTFQILLLCSSIKLNLKLHGPMISKYFKTKAMTTWDNHLRCFCQLLLVGWLVISLRCVSSIGHIHGENCFCFLFNQCLSTVCKAYNQFVPTYTYELKKCKLSGRWL